MQIRRNHTSPGLVAASGGAAPTSAIVGWNGSAVPESLRCGCSRVQSHRGPQRQRDHACTMSCSAGRAGGWMVAAAVTVRV